MKRRTFLQTSSIVTLPFMLRGMAVTTVGKSSLMNLISPENDKILVLVQMVGGNDGLNTFIPLDKYEQLVKVRGDILLPESKVLKVRNENAFHRNLTGFKGLYDEGKMSIIQSVSYPNQNRSHFRSTDIWTSASDSDDFVTSGWLGRYFDVNHYQFPVGYPNAQYKDPFAITMGNVVSETCQGTVSNFSSTLNDPSKLIQIYETEASSSQDGYYGDELEYLKNSVRQSNEYSKTIADAFDTGRNVASYPETNLATQLKNTARLISGGLSTKIYVVSLGGFDTHANQTNGTDTLTGEHADLMQTLGDAIAAFQNDLKALGVEQRVMGMTFSEFGRRIKANNSFGTDHGTAAPVFVFGSCAKGGIVGENPNITDNVTDDEGVAMQYDFRSVYASLLIDWFGVPRSEVESILFKDFQHLPIVEGCSLTDVEQEELIIEANIFPNPAQNSAMLTFKSNGGSVHVAIYNVIGSLLKTVMDKKVSAGNHEMSIELNDLPVGSYFVRIAEATRQKTLKLVIIK